MFLHPFLPIERPPCLSSFCLLTSTFSHAPIIPILEHGVEKNYRFTILQNCRAGGPPAVVGLTRIVAASLCRGDGRVRFHPRERSRDGCFASIPKSVSLDQMFSTLGVSRIRQDAGLYLMS